MKNETVNAISVDVEDYYHVSAFSKYINKTEWDSLESRVERNTQRILEIFNNEEVKATFFILGWIAEKYPKLIKEISDYGHEIACHGYSHDLIYTQSKEDFQKETIMSKRILEDIVGSEVIGYRAASYSITNRSLWALDVLAQAGFKYDSSIFPILHDRYGIKNAEPFPHVVKTEKGNSIIEFPISTIKMLSFNVPISGGGYFRLYPYWLTRLGLRKINLDYNSPFIFYMHPWELDVNQPKIDSNYISKFRHYNNIDKFETRLLKLVNDFRFTTVSEVIKEIDLEKV
jgi:polysaccharide deacetylase family protein (PEP-CTERM system associated)